MSSLNFVLENSVVVLRVWFSQELLMVMEGLKKVFLEKISDTSMYTLGEPMIWV